MKDDLNKLVNRPPAEVRLGEPAIPLAMRTKTGLEREAAANVEGEEVEVQSTDGVFTFVVRVIKA